MKTTKENTKNIFQIFAEPESLHNFIKVSYEQHLYLLECLEDKLMQLLLEWQEQKIGHLAK